RRLPFLQRNVAARAGLHGEERTSGFALRAGADEQQALALDRRRVRLRRAFQAPQLLAARVVADRHAGADRDDLGPRRRHPDVRRRPSRLETAFEFARRLPDDLAGLRVERGDVRAGLVVVEDVDAALVNHRRRGSAEIEIAWLGIDLVAP